MSAETYFEINVPGREFEDNFLYLKQKEKTKSPPVIIAEGLLTSAGSGIREYYNRKWSRQGNQDLQINEPYNVNTMVFASMILSIDSMIWDKKFNYTDFKNEIDKKLMLGKGMQFPDYKVPEGDVDIPDDDWSKMIKSAINDKTLSCFFENPMLLPEVPKTVLTASARGFNMIRNEILPKYTAIAQLVCK